MVPYISKNVFQLVPLFVMDVLGPAHGVPGLFAAAVFSATLRYIKVHVISWQGVDFFPKESFFFSFPSRYAWRHNSVLNEIYKTFCDNIQGWKIVMDFLVTI